MLFSSTNGSNTYKRRFLSSAKNMARNIGKNISENLSSK